MMIQGLRLKALPRFSMLALIVLTLCPCPSLAQDNNLAPGTPAPPLDVKVWFKGAPIKQLEKGQIYVVEFWATWCGPCIESIPHLTELAKKNPDVKFIGVSIWEKNEGDAIKKFVAEMGDKMDYTVGWSGDQDGMAKSWAEAGAQNGIPTSFIVKNGIIQWIGHPMALEKPLLEIKAGSFDIQKAKLAFDKQAIVTRRQMAMNQEITEIEHVYNGGNHEAARASLAAYLKKYPSEEERVETFRFQWLADEDVSAWKLKARSYADSRTPANIGRLCSFAIRQTFDAGNKTLGEFALNLAIEATEQKQLLPLNYGLSYYERTRQFDKALSVLNKIEKLLPTLPADQRASWEGIVAKKRKEYEAKVKE
jgi:thiol-disulfide isomerase/thioredoxin